MNSLEQMNQTLQALWLRLVTPQQLHYINGADTLPRRWPRSRNNRPWRHWQRAAGRRGIF